MAIKRRSRDPISLAKLIGDIAPGQMGASFEGLGRPDHPPLACTRLWARLQCCYSPPRGHALENRRHFESDLRRSRVQGFLEQDVLRGSRSRRVRRSL
jgi:hypothetical protein